MSAEVLWMDTEVRSHQAVHFDPELGGELEELAWSSLLLSGGIGGGGHRTECVTRFWLFLEALLMLWNERERRKEAVRPFVLWR